MTGSPALALRGARVFVAGDEDVAAGVAALGAHATPTGHVDDDVEAQQRVLRAFEAWLRMGDGALVLADGASGALPAPLTRALIDVARGAGVPVVVHPDGGDWSRYAGATAIAPGRAEAATVARHSGIHELCDAVLSASGAENVVLSLAADGVVAKGAALPETLRVRCGAPDAAGAGGSGDTLVAVLATGLAARRPLAATVELAGAAATSLLRAV